GQLYAFSTVGSVLGILITGYFLLPFLGISGSLFTAAALVFITFFLGKRYIFGTVGLSAIVFLASVITNSHSENVLLDKSNGYHRIKVISSQEDPNVRLLYLDSTLEGAMLLGSSNPGMPYHRSGVLIADVIPDLARCLFLGGGTFSIPKYIKSKYPGAEVNVAEIDPDVMKAAEEFFELPSELNVLIGDARRILKDSQTSFDLIVNDAFRGVRNIPFHLVTRQFHKLVAEKLSLKGIYAVNVMGYPVESRLVSSVTRTLKQDFTYVNHFRSMKEGIQNIWILASKQPISVGRPVLSEAEAGMIFTDNHAPVEFLIALDLLSQTKILHRETTQKF
ncbi:MAG: fused MFS/spermidine synthase, partial [Bacteroidota bacterium]|nr:fused MFS/spermidine synthase [Bacteroidota bacterium]